MRLLTTILFLLLVGLFFRFAKQRHVATVERDLTAELSEINQSLAADGLGGVAMEIDHLDIHVIGQAADGQPVQGLLAKLRDLPGGYVINNVEIDSTFSAPAPDPVVEPVAVVTPPPYVVTPPPVPVPARPLVSPSRPVSPEAILSPPVAVSPPVDFAPALPTSASPSATEPGDGIRLPSGFIRPSAPARPSNLSAGAPITPPEVVPSVSPHVLSPPTVISSAALPPPVIAPPPPVVVPPPTVVPPPEGVLPTVTPPRTGSESFGTTVGPGAPIQIDAISLLRFTRTLGDCTLQFGADGASVPDSEQAKLNQVAQSIRQHPGLPIGLRSQVGDKTTAAVQLGLRRAEGVRDRLVQLGVAAERLNVRQPRYAGGVGDRLDFEVVDE